MTGAEAATGIESHPAGWREWIRPFFGWFRVVCIITSLLCAAVWLYMDFHSPESSNETTVNITSSGFLSISSDILDDGNTVQVTSLSSDPVDVVVKDKDGRDIFTYSGLMPGENFNFKRAEHCTVIASAS